MGKLSSPGFAGCLRFGCQPVTTGAIRRQPVTFWMGGIKNGIGMTIMIRIMITIKTFRGTPPTLGGLDPLHRYNPHGYWVLSRSHPLHLPLQAATGATGLCGCFKVTDTG